MLKLVVSRTDRDILMDKAAEMDRLFSIQYSLDDDSIEYLKVQKANYLKLLEYLKTNDPEAYLWIRKHEEVDVSCANCQKVYKDTPEEYFGIVFCLKCDEITERLDPIAKKFKYDIFY